MEVGHGRHLHHVTLEWSARGTWLVGYSGWCRRGRGPFGVQRGLWEFGGSESRSSRGFQSWG